MKQETQWTVYIYLERVKFLHNPLIVLLPLAQLSQYGLEGERRLRHVVRPSLGGVAEIFLHNHILIEKLKGREVEEDQDAVT